MDSIFEGNYASFYGGAIYLSVNTRKNDILIKRAEFISNVAELGGGGVLHLQTVEIADCLFYNNSAREGGGISEYKALTRK